MRSRWIAGPTTARVVECTERIGHWPVVLSRFECGDGWDADAWKSVLIKVLDEEVSGRRYMVNDLR